MAFLTDNLLANPASRFFHFRKHAGFLIGSHAGSDMTPFPKNTKAASVSKRAEQSGYSSKAKQAVM